MVVTALEMKTAVDQAIGTILAKTSESGIKSVIGAITYEKSEKENVELIKGYSRNELIETHKFLKTLGTDYPAPCQSLNPNSRNKDQYAEDIFNFINLLKPTQCTVCNENYVPTNDDYEDNKVKCFLCKRPSHHDCYKDLTINPDIGIIFLCSECLSVRAATELSKKLSNDETKDATSASLGDDGSSEEKPKNKPDHVERIPPTEDCPLYLERKCPHGLTGKREINGNPCPYKHRRLCLHFAANGPDGCRFGNRCKYFHPKNICQNSINLQACLNKDCPDFHIKGTRRRAEPNPGGYRQQSGQQYTSPRHITPWINNDDKSPSTSPEHSEKIEQRTQTSSSELSKDFLFKQMESMKSDLLKYTSHLIKETIQQSLPSLVQTFSNQQQIQNTIPPENRPVIYHHQNLMIPENRQVPLHPQKESQQITTQNPQREENSQQIAHQPNYQFSQMIPVQTYHPQLVTTA